MDLTRDARHAVPALTGLLLGRREALKGLDLSRAAFWRVFWLVLGIILTGEVAFAALTARDSLLVAHHGALVGLSVLGGSAAAVQIMMVMGMLEDWDHLILRFLIPLLWIAAILWSAVLVWRVASFGMELSGWADWWPRIALSGVALYTAWQAARFGLCVSRIEAAGVLLASVCAEFVGFVFVNGSLLLIAGL